MLLLLLACTTYDTTPTFSGGASTSSHGSESQDTGATDDTGGSGAGDAPELLTITGEFIDDPDIGITMTVYISFDDPSDSLVGGDVYPSFDGSLGTSDSETYAIGDYSLGETDGAYVDPDSGDLYFAVIGLDETDSYTLSAYVVDASGQTSNTVTGSADAY